MNAAYFDNKTLTGAYQALAAASLVMSITIAADPANAADALVRVAGGSPITLPPGKSLPLAGVDLATIQVKCDDGGRVLVAGPVSIRNARRQARLNAAGIPAPPPSVEAGGPYSTTNAIPVQLAGTASNVDSVRWETSGDGTFDDDTSLTAQYTPGAGDRTAGAGQNVTLTLVGVVGGMDVVDDDANVGVTITGTASYIKMQTVGTHCTYESGSGSWTDEDAGFILGQDVFEYNCRARVRFGNTPTSGTAPPAGATLTAAAFRGSGDGSTGLTRKLTISGFASSGTLSAYAGSFTAGAAAQNFNDDGGEHSVNLSLSAVANVGSNQCLQFIEAEGNPITIYADFGVSGIADCFIDVAWSKAPPSP